MEKNKYGFVTDRANLKFTNNIMLGCSINEGITWKYFGRNQHGTLQKARGAMNHYMRSQHEEKDSGNNF